MSSGADRLLKEHGSLVGVAEALILGNMASWEQEFVDEIISPMILEVARIRLAAKGLLNPENIK